jgi:hypothetical protein
MLVSLSLSASLDLSPLSVAELKSEMCQKHLIQIFSWILAIGLSSFSSSSPPPTRHTTHLSTPPGNYMNGGTNKGQAHGIKLSGLVCSSLLLALLHDSRPGLSLQLKLIDCKKNQSKMETLLHFIARLVHGNEISSTTETFYSEWTSVWDAKNVSPFLLLALL